MSWPDLYCGSRNESNEWPHKRPPQFPVTMVTTRDELGIDYEVRVCDGNPSAYEEGEDQTSVWSMRVDFGTSKADRAGGTDFRLTAQRQQQVADQWVAAIVNSEDRAADGT